jgi:hypothetical protein
MGKGIYKTMWALQYDHNTSMTEARLALGKEDNVEVALLQNSVYSQTDV